MTAAKPVLVDAEWVAGYEVITADNTVLSPGSTYKVPEFEANESDNWKVVDKPIKKTAPADQED